MVKSIKNILFLGKIFLSLALILLFISSQVLAKDGKLSSLPEKVAIVNGVFISKSDFLREVMRIYNQIASQGGIVNASQLDKFKKTALETLINLELLYQESQKKGIKVDENEVTQAYNAMKKQFPDESKFKKEMKNLELTEESLKERIRKKIAIRNLIDQELMQNIKIPESEMKKFYDQHTDVFKTPEQVRVSHILIMVDPSKGEEGKKKAREKIEKIKEMVKNGEEFGALAKKYSEGPSKDKGGDLGYIRRGQVVKPFEDAAFSLKKGQVSDIVETRFGYHLIKVTDRKPPSKIPFKEIKGKIKNYLMKKELEKNIAKYINDLKNNAKIERFIQ